MESYALVQFSDLSSIPYQECKAGHLNMDGKCVQGGVLAPKNNSGPNLPQFGEQYAKQCVAYPVYMKEYLPYQQGRIAGNNDKSMSTLNFGTKLLRPYP